MRTPPRLLAPLLVGALALAGCGGEASPKPAPLTKTPTASATSPSPPAVPDALQGTDEAAARALVKYYLDLDAYASVTGDTTRLRSLATPTCAACSRLVSVITTTYSAGGRSTGTGFEVERFREVTADDVGFKVVADVLSNPETFKPDRTSAPSANPAGRAVYTFFITKTPTRLLIDAWGFDK